jgi:hypothetical protein
MGIPSGPIALPPFILLAEGAWVVSEESGYDGSGMRGHGELGIIDEEWGARETADLDVPFGPALRVL